MNIELGQRIRKRRELLGMTQDQLAQRVGCSQPAIKKIEAGGNTRLLIEIAHALDTSAEWLKNGGAMPIEVRESAPLYGAVHAAHPEDELDDDWLAVPESKVAFSAGPGYVPTFELVDEREPVTYRRSWFQKEHINPKRVRRFRVVGDSMEPFLFAGDSILVNLDETNIVDGRVYAIRYGDDLRVKILSRRLDGTLTLRSFNSEKYKDEEVPAMIAAEQIAVIGRVRDKSGTGGL